MKTLVVLLQVADLLDYLLTLFQLETRTVKLPLEQVIADLFVFVGERCVDQLDSQLWKRQAFDFLRDVCHACLDQIFNAKLFSHAGQVHLVDGGLRDKAFHLLLDLLLLRVSIARVSHNLVEQLLLLGQLFGQELPPISFIEEVIGAAWLLQKRIAIITHLLHRFVVDWQTHLFSHKL